MDSLSDKLQGVSVLDLEGLEARRGIMPPLKKGEEQEDETLQQNEVEGKIGPTDQFGLPLKYAYRRAFSDMELLESLRTPDFTFQKGWCYCFMSRGDVDLSSYLKLMLKHTTCDHLIVSTWHAEEQDFTMMHRWMEQGRIKRLDVYLGRLYCYGSGRRFNIRRYREIMADMPAYTVKVFRNHSKVIAGTGPDFSFVIQGSANMNTNVNAENVCIIIDDAAFAFYRDFFKEIKSLI